MLDECTPKVGQGTKAAEKGEWVGWIKKFWFLRGAVAAITLSTLIPKYTSISYLEFLRVFNVLIIAWNQITLGFANYLASFEILRFVNHAMVNTFILASTFVLPALLFLFREKSRFLEALTVQVVYSGGIPSPLRATNKTTAKVVYLIYVLSLFAAVPWTYFLLANPDLDSPLTTMMLATIGYCFVGALFTLNGLFNGMVTVVVFVGTLQLLYYFNTPVLTETVNRWACAHVDTRFDKCGVASP